MAAPGPLRPEPISRAPTPRKSATGRPFRLGDVPRPVGRRKRWAIAIGASAVAHLIVFLLLISGIPNPTTFYVDRAIDLDLMRFSPPPRPPEPEPKLRPTQTPEAAPQKPKPILKPPPQPIAPAPAARPVPAPPQQTQLPPAPPAASAGAGRGPASGGAVAAGRGASPDEAGRANCIAKNLDKMDPKERLACETHVFAFMDRQQKIETPQDPALDPAKKAEYDAALARKHYKGAPASLGNGSQAGCNQANLGMGCPGEATIPIWKSSQ